MASSRGIGAWARFALAQLALVGWLGASGCSGGGGGGGDDVTDAGGPGDGDGLDGDGGPGDRDGGGFDPEKCGNGTLDSGEKCDDGNDTKGDGCNAKCQVESGFACYRPGAQCSECGNGIIEPTAIDDKGTPDTSDDVVSAEEECDDNNRDANDGCDASCKVEEGNWACAVPGEPCEECGDGVVDPNERCDEGASADGVGCSDDCRSIDEWYHCYEGGEECVECGNGVREADEACDDGNHESGDGCVPTCIAVEAGWVCNPDGGGCTLCGDGVVNEDLEECDDGNFQGDDGCSTTCTLDAGATCVPGTFCVVCGNGYIEELIDDKGTADTGDDVVLARETCDDGNLDDLDGCTSSCEKDPDYLCPIPGVACNVCGNGAVEGIEACDEGVNTTAGCSDDCLDVVPPYNCFAEGQACEECGDGVREGGEACDDGKDPTLNVPVSGDGCSRTCREVESGFTCTENASGLTSCIKCGNGKLESGEQCDDFNTSSGDGCSNACVIEPGYNCFFAGFPCVECGNGVLEPGESCDEGSVLANQTEGCSDSCQVVDPWLCPLSGEPCQLCGDNSVDTLETCDDGNNQGGDGCSSTCDVEPGYDCSGDQCLAAACGDGAPAGDEACDDGNQLSGDGCSFACNVEQGWVCPAGINCRRVACGDSVVEGNEQCDDAGECTDGSPCIVKRVDVACIGIGDELCNEGQCDDGTACTINRVDEDCLGVGTQLCSPVDGDGCDESCNFEPGFACPVPGQACVATECGDGVHEGYEQCDDGKQCADGTPCTDDATVCAGGAAECLARSGDGCTDQCAFEPGFYCPVDDAPCEETECGDGLVQGLEPCDDGNQTDNDGCSGSSTNTCEIDELYRCDNEADQPSSCRPIIEFVSIRRFNISNVSPPGLAYDPARRAFSGHKSQDSQEAIELCLDGTVIDPNDTTAGTFGTIYRADGTVEAVSPDYLVPPRPVSAGTLVGASYDPFTGHTLFLTTQGSTTTLTDVPLCTVADCAVDSFQPGDDIRDFQVNLSGVDTASGLTVGEDGDLYITDSTTEAVLVFPRRRDGSLEIVVPDCVGAAQANCTTFASAADGSRDWAVASTSPLDAIFTVPGENLLGVFNNPGLSDYSGFDELRNTTVVSGEYFRFFDPSAPLPAFGDSSLPGLLFDLGALGTSYGFEAKAAETAPDGAAFIVCPRNPSEDCQLFARTCETDEDCAAIAPGTTCNTQADVPYCNAPGAARDDNVFAERQSQGNVIDVLANDSLSESACIDPVMKVVKLTGVPVCVGGNNPGVSCAAGASVCDGGTCGGASGNTVTTAQGGTVTISNNGDDVTYTAPAEGCGFIDTFQYTADLGGGVLDDATVRVVIKCVCGDGVLDGNEQCDLGDANGPLPARCSDACSINIVCGDAIVDPGEECDNGLCAGGTNAGDTCTDDSQCPGGSCAAADPVSGDGCSAFCTLESVCGDGNVEGVEECDDGNTVSGDTCNNCLEPECGDGNVDVQLGEECDDGISNSNDASALCNTLCQVVCGNGRVQSGEQCDDGGIQAGDGCSAQCTLEGACGNGAIESTEECDPNAAATQCGGEAACGNLCVCENYCGDGRIGGLEQCDDGNAESGDGCRNTSLTLEQGGCTLEVCGDGIKDPSEQCDDGNNDPADKCTNNCLVIAICGDGVLDAPIEECDDDNNVSGDGCSSTCKNEVSACGNGTRELGEQCDNGTQCTDGTACTDAAQCAGKGDGTCAPRSGDGCSATCLNEGAVCGNGVREQGENCDDGNTNSGDGCDKNCQTELQ